MSRLSLAALATLMLAGSGLDAQSNHTRRTREPVHEGRPLSAWVDDLLHAPAPQTRNAAAYAISGLGPAAKAAVPALIQALKDTEETVRYPACVALREIGPDAGEAVPALTEALDDRSDDVASMARKAIIQITGTDPRPPE